MIRSLIYYYRHNKLALCSRSWRSSVHGKWFNQPIHLRGKTVQLYFRHDQMLAMICRVLHLGASVSNETRIWNAPTAAPLATRGKPSSDKYAKPAVMCPQSQWSCSIRFQQCRTSTNAGVKWSCICGEQSKLVKSVYPVAHLSSLDHSHAGRTVQEHEKPLITF